MDSLQVFNAFDGTLIEELPQLDEVQALALVAQAHQLFENRSEWLPLRERIAILAKAALLIQQRRQDLAMQAAQEGGKPLTDSLIEIDRAVEGIQVAVEAVRQLHGEEVPMGLNAASAGRMAYTRHLPRGVVLAISAFNHPFNLIVHQVIPAIAAGCPVLVKPAVTTPLSCRALLQILYEAGLPQAWCEMVICENDVAETLVSDARTAFLTFIGSAKVGWYLRSQLPPGATCALEHGGAAPVIVDESANLDKAIPLLVKGGFYHAGQVCVSVQRIMAHQSIVQELQERMAEAVEGLKVGDPTLLETEVGPLILPREVDRVDGWVQAAIGRGAEKLCGAQKISDTCYAPTLLASPPLDADVSTKEIFGPVACIYGYESLDEAIAQANALDYAFQASIFSNRLDVTLQAIERLEGMAVMVNDHTAFRVDWMPFGGYKQSGLGTGGIGHTLKDMTVAKMFVINNSF